MKKRINLESGYVFGKRVFVITGCSLADIEADLELKMFLYDQINRIEYAAAHNIPIKEGEELPPVPIDTSNKQ